MRIPKLKSSSRLTLALAVGVVSFLPACSINVKKNDNGEDKKVDIDTPFGNIHVDKGADARDTGLPIYPGSRIKQDREPGDDKSANVDISGMGFGLKVVALQYESDDAPAKIIAYYKDQLKKYGSVLECHTTGHSTSFDHDHWNDSHGDRAVRCDGDSSGKTVELKVGTDNNQHIVSIEPQDKGANFALVFVQAHGKDTI